MPDATPKKGAGTSDFHKITRNGRAALVALTRHIPEDWVIVKMTTLSIDDKKITLELERVK